METVEPTFIRMGESDLINLNAVQRIKLNKDMTEVTFIFPEYATASFAVEDCETILSLVKIPYTLSTK